MILLFCGTFHLETLESLELPISDSKGCGLACRFHAWRSVGARRSVVRLWSNKLPPKTQQYSTAMLELIHFFLHRRSRISHCLKAPYKLPRSTTTRTPTRSNRTPTGLKLIGPEHPTQGTANSSRPRHRCSSSHSAPRSQTACRYLRMERKNNTHKYTTHPYTSTVH